MHIAEKIFMDREGLEENGPITIVAFGDSVTHGALRDGMNYETVYWNLLRKKILEVRNYVPVNIINAGIGGVTARESVIRIEKQVLCHNPDLVIVCFGLNDVNDTLKDYLDALEIIFEKCKSQGSDVIFLTPNMLNTYVADDTPEEYLEYAEVTAEYQNTGKMDMYINEAVKLAERKHVPVCDCYAEWKKIAETEDVTQLLINRINHPIPQMHKLFAEKLYEMILGDVESQEINKESTMY